MTEMIEILLDVYRHDPESAIAMAMENDALIDLFEKRMENLREGGGLPNWDVLCLMARGLSGMNRRMAFSQIVMLAQQYAQQRELLEVLMQDRTESTVIDRNQAIFTPLFMGLREKDLELVEGWEFAIGMWYIGKMERMITVKNFKRAFDTLVDAARALCRAQGPLEHTFEEGLRPKELDEGHKNTAYGLRMREIAENQMLNLLIEMVWGLHRRHNLVPEISDDAEAWENQAQHTTVVYGKSVRGRGPRIMREDMSLPLAWLWGAYADIGEIYSPYCPVDKVESGCSDYDYDGAGKDWYPVRKPGNKLRLLIRYHHMLAKRKKLVAFCEQHGLELPAE